MPRNCVEVSLDVFFVSKWSLKEDFMRGKYFYRRLDLNCMVGLVMLGSFLPETHIRLGKNCIGVMQNPSVSHQIQTNSHDSLMQKLQFQLQEWFLYVDIKKRFVVLHWFSSLKRQTHSYTSDRERRRTQPEILEKFRPVFCQI